MWDHHLQPVMKGGKSYVKGTNHFLEKLKEPGKVPPNAILVTADAVGLYPSVLHDAGLKTLHEKLEERNDKSVPMTDLVNMVDFVLKNNYFEFGSCFKWDISGTAIGTRVKEYKKMGMDEVHRWYFLNLEWKSRYTWKFLAKSKCFPS